MGDIVKVDINSFEKEILEHSGIVLVDFWAEWCGPCKIQLPVLEEISEELSNIKICKVNVDENTDLAVKYGIRSIPTMMIFRDGEKKDQLVGFKNKIELTEKLETI